MKPRLFLQSPYLWLVIVPLVLYAKIVFFDFTALDDQFFVIDHAGFNQHLGNIFSAFSQGLFVPKNDSYYRPVFLIDMIIENHLFGVSPWGYHLMSLLFHIASVCLLYLFLHRIKLGETPALVLALVFAVHPVLTQTVAWIPGRNDMLLMIFLLTGMIFTINYALRRKWQDFVLQLVFFLLAIFTKETAIIIPLLTFFILLFVIKTSGKPLVFLSIGWGATIFFWFFMESAVKQSGNKFPVREMIESAISRIPAFPQYLGKIFFPVNLSVHPQVNEISMVWGILAIAVTIALVFFSGSFRKPLTILGILWFLLFLLPVLAVPKIFNDLVYEHRLYIPMIGILLVLSQTFLFSGKLSEWQQYLVFGLVILGFGAMSFIRVDYFKDPLAYWSRAVVESPGNAYSLEMKATWVRDEAEQERLFREAYAIDPTLKDINLYLGKVAFNNKNYAEAEKFLKKELTLASAKVPDNYFLLGQIAYQQKDYTRVKEYMSEGLKISPEGNAEAYSLIAQACFFENKPDSAAMNLRMQIRLEPQNVQAHNNLLMVYIKLGQQDSAVALVRKMQMSGMEVPRKLLDMVAIK